MQRARAPTSTTSTEGRKDESATAASVPGAGVGALATAPSSDTTSRKEAGNKESVPIREPSPEPVVLVVDSAPAMTAKVLVPSPPPATIGTTGAQVEDGDAEAHRVVSAEEPATVEPNAEPARDRAPRVVPPKMSDEIFDELINDDLLEGGLMKEMWDSLKRVHNYVVVSFL